MKINILIAGTLLAVASFFTSCGHFDEINTDPDTPTSVTAAMLASGGIQRYRNSY